MLIDEFFDALCVCYEICWVAIVGIGQADLFLAKHNLGLDFHVSALESIVT